MKLLIAKPTKDSQEIAERLKHLSLAHQIETSTDVNEIILMDGDQKVIGKTAILEHLESLAGELHQWYYCNC